MVVGNHVKYEFRRVGLVGETSPSGFFHNVSANLT